ncbi:lysM domain receptor-like kinase 3 [Andrographis paniculata]|uniref:lysM domain receptor-like kinase 3 n=1 Tax=Andrographis paniculata TaxID=175694 RepID=UPI0021E9755C|nr:lysM domain receptor-like kinase 3 [Andrographis paniculata]
MSCPEHTPVFLLLLAGIFAIISSSASEKGTYPFLCSDKIKSCDALLYQRNGFDQAEIAASYAINASAIKTLQHAGRQDYLVPVNCSCKNINGTAAYFYDVVYTPEIGDTFSDVSTRNFSGQVWDGGADTNLTAGEDKILHLLCGCLNNTNSRIVVTYTVEAHDTISSIANLLSAQEDQIEALNEYLAPNPSFIEAGWLLYVPMELHPKKAAKKVVHKWMLMVILLSIITALSVCTMVTVFLRRKMRKRKLEDDPKALSKNISTKSHSLQIQQGKNSSDVAGFDSEKPLLYSIEEISEATRDFDEARKIGQGGYGSVYYGVIGEQEVAIKKMRSNKTKEFLAELKVLCKIHHINVVELLGYASGDDHLYLVYEFVPNGSLSEHLHDPLLKGHQPLTWSARTQVALDAARGIEYIHDHTKARYVHRDIKTSNILLDQGLGAKVADFGLAKLVGRSNEDELIATRLVGTPGYLPPESVKELQVTVKTDVFAFGVVLGELITGHRALIRDNQQPNRMKSLITIINGIFNSEDPESAVESVVDGNLKGNYPLEDAYKMAEVARWCLSEEAIDRPEMREVVVALSRIRMSSVEWEASLGGNGQIFSGVFSGR